MTEPPALGTGSRLTFNGPLSPDRADRLAHELAATRPSTVVDLGCGWGELLLRVLAAAPEARGVGIDIHAADLDRARRAAADRGLADRVTFVAGPAEEYHERADVVLSLGAYQAFGTVPVALAALRDRVRPGGIVLAGIEYWERPPTGDELAAMWAGTTAEDCTDLYGLVRYAIDAGLRPLRIEVASRDEWDEFQSGFLAELEHWLVRHDGHERAPAVRDQLDDAYRIWLRGHRDVMGLAYLTLGSPSTVDEDR